MAVAEDETVPWVGTPLSQRGTKANKAAFAAPLATPRSRKRTLAQEVNEWREWSNAKVNANVDRELKAMEEIEAMAYIDEAKDGEKGKEKVSNPSSLASYPQCSICPTTRSSWGNSRHRRSRTEATSP